MESKLQKKIKKLATAAGLLCYKVEASAVVGFPDLFIAGGGRIVLVELKNGKRGRFQPGQERMHERLTEAGVEVYVIDNINDAGDLVDNWGSDPGATAGYNGPV